MIRRYSTYNEINKTIKIQLVYTVRRIISHFKLDTYIFIFIASFVDVPMYLPFYVSTGS